MVAATGLNDARIRWSPDDVWQRDIQRRPLGAPGACRPADTPDATPAASLRVSLEEEGDLDRAYPGEYRHYRERVGRLLPNLMNKP